MRKRRALREADQRRDAALRHVAVTLFTLDASGCCAFAQGRHCDVLGLLPDAPVPSTSPLHDPSRRALAGETVDVALDAGTTALDCRLTPLRDEHDAVVGAAGFVTDVTERRRRELDTEYLAFHDRLTDLPNHAGLERLLDTTLAEAAGGPVALLHLDVDDFKLVNVGLGHEAGDVVLAELAWRLAAAAPTGATLTRVGEDHFVLVVPGDADAARSAANALLDAVQAPFTVAGAEFQLGATIGIGLSGEHAQGPDALLTAAELAGHQAKHGRRGGYAFYQEDGSDPRRRLALTTRLRHAIDDGEFVLHYQPVYRLATGALHSVEALIRWQHPEEGTISPVAFIPLAEETGLIQGIGDWVIDAVARQASAWEAEGIRPHISFNVAPAQLRRAFFADRLGDRLREAALPPTGFTVEITESAAMSDAQETRRVLEQLEDIGVRIALDDFGTDHSSLARLRTLPVHQLKIDRPFLAGVPADAQAAAVIEAVLRLADALGMEAVAEGIERREQLEFLAAHGCALGQGFHLARPMPPEAVTTLLRAGREVGGGRGDVATAVVAPAPVAVR
jgi:diguanylate cyclase (GGDEF)-like protein